MEKPQGNHFRNDIYKVNGKAMVDLGLSLGLSAMSLDLEGTAAEPG